MSESSETLSLVVTGPMNPPLHHPAWYESVGVLKSDEREHALRQGPIVLPQLARFDTGVFAVHCEPGKWELKSTTLSVEEIRQIVSTVFDTALIYTQVTAIGLNYLNHLPTECLSVTRACVDRLTSCGLLANADSAKFAYRLDVGNGALLINVEPSVRGDSLLYVGANAHLNVRDELKREGSFSLGRLVTDWHGVANPVVQQEIDRLVKTMGETDASA